MKHLGCIAKILLIVGGLNWGLVAWADINLVEMIVGSMPMVAKGVYSLVALSALYCLYGMVTGKCGGDK